MCILDIQLKYNEPYSLYSKICLSLSWLSLFLLIVVAAIYPYIWHIDAWRTALYGFSVALALSYNDRCLFVRIFIAGFIAYIAYNLWAIYDPVILVVISIVSGLITPGRMPQINGKYSIVIFIFYRLMRGLVSLFGTIAGGIIQEFFSPGTEGSMTHSSFFFVIINITLCLSVLGYDWFFHRRRYPFSR